jgi:hypothetical protein
MYTNALANPAMSWHMTSGIVDWPHFLALVLSHLAGDPSLFDVVLSRPPHLAHISYPKKNFARVTEALAAAGRPVGDHQRIIFFDDKPGEILGTTERFIAWHAPEYTVPVTFAQIDSMLGRLIAPDSTYRWAEYTTEAIRSEIFQMSTRCGDSLIPLTCAGVSSWCGFDIDAHLPLPVVQLVAPAVAAVTAVTAVAAVAAVSAVAVIVDSKPEPIRSEPSASTSTSTSKSRHISLNIELTLKVSVGRRNKKKSGASAHDNAHVHKSNQISFRRHLPQTKR